MAQLMSIKRNVEMCPGQVSVPAIYHVSQGDKGTRIILGLVNNSANYTIPEGTTATIRGHRADGTLFTEITADVETTEVKFNLTEDMSAIPGRAECEAVLASGSANIIGTANFIIDVEKSPASIGSVFPGTDAATTWLIDELTNLDLSSLDDESVVDAINSKANESTIAPEFDSSASYTAGQMVLKNGVLYRFTSDHAAGAWSDADAVVVTVGGEVEEAKQSISQNLDLFGSFHNLVNYGYSDDGIVSRNGVSVKRYLNTILLNNTRTASYNFTVKLTGNVAILHNNTEVAGLQTGASFEAGHRYKLTLKLISGTMSGGIAAATVYRVGESSSVGTGGASSQNEYVRTFTAEDNTNYNICIYFISSNRIENAKLVLVMEDLTESSNQNEKQDAKLLSLYDTNSGAFRFTQGGYSRAGAKLTGNYLKWYLVSGDYIQKNVYKCIASAGYKITAHAWENETYKGFLAGENRLTTTASTAVYWASQINMAQLREAYPNYDFRIEICNSLTAQGTNTPIYTDESSYVSFVEVQTSGIRDYYKAEMDKTIKEVRDVITEPCVVFPVVTDIHFLSTSNFSSLYNVCAENIAYFCDNVPCDFILNLGDNTDGDTSQSETIKRSMHILNSLAKTHTPYLQAVGNHDTNYFGSFDRLTMKQTYSAYLSSVHDVVFTEEDGNSNYYKDLENIGVRVVVLNANYGNRYIFSSATASWLSEKAFNTNKMILLCVHLSSINTQNWEARSLTNGTDVTNAIQSFINNGGKLIQLCGHSHADYYFSSPWLSIFSGCQKFEQVDVNTSGFLAITGYEGSIYSAPRTLKTESEDLWTVGVLMPVSGMLAMVRFGAGKNRYFHFFDTDVASTVTLSSILSGELTWATGDASVASISDGVVTAIGSGKCQITAMDTDGNFETWSIVV